VTGYDFIGRATSATDPRGGVTTYSYDQLNRVRGTTDALKLFIGSSHITDHDQNGNLTTDFVDFMPQLTGYQYDALNHLVGGRRTSTTDQTGAIIHFAYDDEGQLTSVTDALGRVTQYSYDSGGNVTSVTDAKTSTPGVTRYEYDLLNRRTKRTLPLGMSETF